MLLAVDIGNTNVVLGLLKEGELCVEARFASNTRKTTDDVLLEFSNFFNQKNIAIEEIEDAIISSVVPLLSKTYEQALVQLLKRPIYMVGPGIKTGLNIKLDTPSQLGADMVVTAVGALAKYRPPLMIFDLGTATTLSVLDETGAFIGGQILTGVKLSLEALGSRTAQLPYVDLNEDAPLIGKNTLDCLRAGAIYGHASMIDGLAKRVKSSFPKDKTPLVIGTGGLFNVIHPYCEEEIIKENHLLLDGLYHIYLKNKGL